MKQSVLEGKCKELESRVRHSWAKLAGERVKV